jgi:hypothetical protein
LKYTIAGDPTPGAENGQMRHGCLRPGYGATIRRWARLPS